MTIEDLDNTSNFSPDKNQPLPVQIKVLGVGGGDLLPGFVRFGLEVQVVDGAGGVIG